MIIITCVLFVLLFAIFFYAIYRMNLYIGTLEEKIKEQIELTENLKQSLKDIIAEDFLNNDGRLKKFRIQKERNIFFNGVDIVKEQEVSLT